MHPIAIGVVAVASFAAPIAGWAAEVPATGAANDFAIQREALDIIKEFAGEQCGPIVPSHGTAKAKAVGVGVEASPLNDLVKKLATLGFTAGGQYQSSEYSGPPPEQLQMILHDNQKCRLHYFNILANAFGLSDAAIQWKPELAAWHHEAVVGEAYVGGEQVAERLSAIQPIDVVVMYDGALNIYHMWYRGSGSGKRYSYHWGTPSDLADGPVTATTFIKNSNIIPAGIGGAGAGREHAVPIYFTVE